MEIKLSEEDALLILGCIDTLGIALSVYNHTFSEGERAIYEESCRILGGMPRGTHFEPDEGEEWQS